MGQRGPVRHDSAGVCFPSGAWFLFQVAGFLLNRKLGVGGGSPSPLSLTYALMPRRVLHSWTYLIVLIRANELANLSVCIRPV